MIRVFTLVLLCTFLCGCGNGNDQGTNTRRDDATSVAKVPDQEVASPQTGSSLVPESTNGAFDATIGLSAGVSPLAEPNGNKSAVRGIIQLPDGTVYEGETSGGKPNGQGILTDRYGAHQKGEWRNGTPYRVSGTVVDPDGTKEVGTWNADGSKSGGTIIWKDGQVYKGEWKIIAGMIDRPDGSGEMTWPDGRKYVGQFRDGKKYGLGKLTYPDGKVEDGSWEQDKFIGAAH